MAERVHTPVSTPAETDNIDDTWEDSDPGAPREPSAPPRQDQRTTAVPSVPPEVLAAATRMSTQPPSRTSWIDDSQFATPTPVAPADIPPPESASRLAALSPQLAKQPLRKSSAPEIEVALSVPPAGTDDTAAHSAGGAGISLELDSIKPVPKRKSDPVDDLEAQIDDALGSGSPLDLVATRADGDRASVELELAVPAPLPEGTTSPDATKDLRDRYAVGDYTGALSLAESILETDPDNAQANRYAESCKEVLTKMYTARLGPLDQLVTVAIPPEQITWLSLDHRAGFLLSLIDGVSSIEEILDISGMSRLEALRIMYTLLQQNVIAIG